MDPLSDDLRQAMDQALTEVERQVRRLAWGELIEQGTDLEWSFNGPDRWSLFIEALRQGHTRHKRCLDGGVARMWHTTPRIPRKRRRPPNIKSGSIVRSVGPTRLVQSIS